MRNSVCNSKILLFGEYSIILNSFGFVIPYPLYGGSLKLEAENKDRDSQKKMLGFIEYLKTIVKNLPDLDWLKINKDIHSLAKEIFLYSIFYLFMIFLLILSDHFLIRLYG